MKERLQKLISRCGAASRRGAEELILAGRVTVNGAPAALGDRADLEADRVELDGKPLTPPEKIVYIMLHKPRGYVTTLSDERGRPTVRELTADCGVRVYPVGRLDLDSEGLLLLTNDGAAAHRLMHPSGEVPKEYLAWVRGDGEAGAARLRQPMELDGVRLLPPAVKLLSQTGEDALLSVTIREGKNRQVRRMCALAGLHVTRLKRVAEGKLTLGDLPRGRWRYLTEAETDYLKSL